MTHEMSRLIDVGAAAAWFEAALNGMAPAWVVCAALVFATLLLEDLAIAAGAALAAQGVVDWPLSFAAVAGGIAAGDLGLYGLGRAATRVRWLRDRLARLGVEGARGTQGPQAAQGTQGQLAWRLPGAVLLARVVPGLRLLTYPACGFLRVPLAAFVAWVVLAVLLWTAGLFWAAGTIGDALSRTWGIPVAIGVALPIVALAGVAAWWRRARAGHRPRRQVP